MWTQTHLVWENKNYTTTDSAARHPSFSRFSAQPRRLVSGVFPLLRPLPWLKKSGFPRLFRSMFGSGTHYTVPASIPAGCSLTASDKLSVSHIVLQELRRLLPLWGSCPPLSLRLHRHLAARLSIVVPPHSRRYAHNTETSRRTDFEPPQNPTPQHRR